MKEKERSYKITKATTPPYEKSDFIINAEFDFRRYHQGNGDMWPITWGLDGHLYAAAGDNRLSPCNFWRIRGEPYTPRGGSYDGESYQNCWFLDLINNYPLDPVKYCRRADVHPLRGIKPAGLLDVEGCMYFAVQLHNSGTNPDFNRQENVSGWIITSWDYGQTWNETATPIDFFTKRLSSIHFVQQGGSGYRNALDKFVYATFPCARDGRSYWENGDCMLLGRVQTRHIIDREHWEFFTGLDKNNAPVWSKDGDKASEIFAYPSMTGENHVSYNQGLNRYIMGNYSFLDDDGNPKPYHNLHWPDNTKRCQLTLYESEKLWGPWKLFYQDDNWGYWGGYQPAFPQKWMYNHGKTMFMVSSGSNDDYNFTVQRLDVQTRDENVHVLKTDANERLY